MSTKDLVNTQQNAKELLTELGKDFEELGLNLRPAFASKRAFEIVGNNQKRIKNFLKELETQI